MDVFKKVQQENPGKKIGELSKIIGDMWKNIDPKDKQKYEANFKTEHEKYAKEKEIYESKFGKIKRNSSKSSEKTEKSKRKSKNWEIKIDNSAIKRSWCSMIFTNFKLKNYQLIKLNLN